MKMLRDVESPLSKCQRKKETLEQRIRGRLRRTTPVSNVEVIGDLDKVTLMTAVLGGRTSLDLCFPPATLTAICIPATLHLLMSRETSDWETEEFCCMQNERMHR